MIYTVGYQRLDGVAGLIELLRRHPIDCLLDVRSKPYSRRAEFNQSRLEKELPPAGIRYSWGGKRLGGFAAIKEEDIAMLAKQSKEEVFCLMCMEDAPEKCHRYYEIAERLKAYGVEAIHLRP